MRIYVAGTMTGSFGHNGPQFNEKTAELRAEGHDVRNPYETTPPEYRELAAKLLGRYRDSPEYHECMRRDIRYILEEAEAIWLLPNWTYSEGARTEYRVAKSIGLELLGAADEPHRRNIVV